MRDNVLHCDLRLPRLAATRSGQFPCVASMGRQGDEMFQIGFHTDAFNSAYWSFYDALDWAAKNDVHFIEPGAIGGVSWIHGLGYQPHIALWEDPYEVRRKMEDLDF